MTTPQDLLTASLHRFADWPNLDVPNWRAGVYGVWRNDEFIYVGMAGRNLAVDAHLEPSAANSTKKKGLRDRLSTHASGRRSGDQFSVYVCDRYVLPSLTMDEIQAVSRGDLFLDLLTRRFIHEHLSYRFVLTNDGRSALALESVIKREGLAGQRPLLNPGPSET